MKSVVFSGTMYY